jgi:hypothetical protein
MDEEIDIKLESLLIEIDNSLEKSLLCVANFEKKMIKRLKYLKKESIKISDLLASNKDFKEKFKDLMKLNKRIFRFIPFRPKIIFEECEKFPKFGKLLNDVQFRKITKTWLKQFEHEDYEIKILDDENIRRATSMCSLDNLHLIIYNRDNEIFILNFQLKIIKLSKIPTAFFAREISSITSDHKETLYLTDISDSQVLCKNINKSGFSKSIGLRGASNSDFLNPCSICFYNDSFYVLDKGNKRVKIYSSYCTLKKIILLWSSNDKYSQFMNNPNMISVTEDIIAVSEDTKSIYIYKFDGHLYCTLANKGFGVYSFICLDNYLFIHGLKGSLRCYDLNKLQQDSILPEFERYSKHIQNKSIAMSYFNERLVILFQDFNYLVAF